MKRNSIAISLVLVIFFTTLFAKDDPEGNEETVDTSVHISGQWFMAYHMDLPDQEDNSLGLKRGYLTFKKRFNETFSVRYTQDITLDREGDDAGNVELRFKYCYLKIDMPAFLFFKEPWIEVGLVHQPWIEFEQKINTYRVQGQMFLERHKVTSSADFGVNIVALLGGTLDDEARKKVDSSLPGKYGSVSFGVYNGGGYHAIEVNNNKTVEGRLTLRPFPGFMPGLQFSYGFAFGEGNDTLNSKYNYNVAMISHETAKITLTAQYYSGWGMHGGGSLGKHAGYSIFGEICVPFTPLTIFGRYDSFTKDIPTVYTLPPYIDDFTNTRVFITGIAWKFYKMNRLLFDIEHTSESGWIDPLSSSMEPPITNTIAELALEIVF
jgi:hypothetical protein